MVCGKKGCNGLLKDISKKELSKYEKLNVLKKYSELSERNEVVAVKMRRCSSCNILQPKWVIKPKRSFLQRVLLSI